MLSKTLLVTALGLTLAAGAAVAAEGAYDRNDYARRGPLPFEAYDLNGDGQVTAQEHERVRAQRRETRAQQGYPMRNAPNAPRFEHIDRDGDGALNRREMSEWQLQRQQQRRPMGGGGRWAQ